jgi:amino acid permease
MVVNATTESTINITSSTRTPTRDRDNHNNNNNNNFNPNDEFTRDATSYIDILSDDFDDDDINLIQQLNNNGNNGNRSNSNGIVASVSKSQRYISLYGTIFNFINCIVGAGAIGLGGAIAQSGGIVSCIIIITVAILVKLSLDLIIDLSINSNNNNNSNSNPPSNVSLSYEDLGYNAFGPKGKLLVMVSKFVYAFGCIVAYTIIIYDNFGPAIRNLFHINPSSHHHKHEMNFLIQWFYWIISNDILCTWFISMTVILPLCLMRDMSTLAGTSFISIIAMLSIVGIVIYLWHIHNNHVDSITNTTTTATIIFDDFDLQNYIIQTTNSTVPVVSLKYHFMNIRSDIYQHWFRIHWFGILNNMGTFVFSFVCHHTVHITYRSLIPEIQNLSTWKYVSTISLCVSCIISLTVALFCYMTFWDRTVSDIFQIYPETVLIDLAKLLLCITMMLTFPLPFFTCRELLILFFFTNPSINNSNDEHGNNTRNTNSILNGRNMNDPRNIDGDLFGDLNEPLLESIDERNDDDEDINNINNSFENQHDTSNSIEAANINNINNEVDDSILPQSGSDILQLSTSMDFSVLSTRAIEVWNSALLPNDHRQLKLMYHIAVTCKLWFIVTVMALAAPNLGDVLDFVGCCSGTLIAFILPAIFAIRLQGWSTIAIIILFVGGLIGTIGTVCSLLKLWTDTFG